MLWPHEKVEGCRVWNARQCYIIRTFTVLFVFMMLRLWGTWWAVRVTGCVVTCEEHGGLCVLLDVCRNLYDLWTPAPNFQGKKSHFFGLIPPSRIFSCATSFLRRVVSEKQSDGQRGALPLYRYGYWCLDSSYCFVLSTACGRLWGA
jgi:hypothetical protein